MRLTEAFEQFDENSHMKDLVAIGDPIKTVAELIEQYGHDRGEYFIAETKYNYGRTVKRSICCDDGTAAFREA